MECSIFYFLGIITSIVFYIIFRVVYYKTDTMAYCPKCDELNSFDKKDLFITCLYCHDVYEPETIEKFTGARHIVNSSKWNPRIL